mgnify:CR=1 FL=1
MCGIAHDEDATPLHVGCEGIIYRPGVGAEEFDLQFRIAHQLAGNTGRKRFIDLGCRFIDVVAPDDQPFIPRPDWNASIELVHRYV